MHLPEELADDRRDDHMWSHFRAVLLWLGILRVGAINLHRIAIPAGSNKKPKRAHDLFSGIYTAHKRKNDVIKQVHANAVVSTHVIHSFPTTHGPINKCKTKSAFTTQLFKYSIKQQTTET